MERPLEYCHVCDEPTGRAGQGDGSLYCECDRGPFCEECWEKHHNSDIERDALVRAGEEILRIAKSDPSFPMIVHVPAIRINMLQEAIEATRKEIDNGDTSKGS